MEDYKEKLREIINSNRTPYFDIEILSKYFPELIDDERSRLLSLVKSCYEDGGRAIPIDEYESLTNWIKNQEPSKTPQWMIDFLDGYRRRIGIPLDYDETRDVDGKIISILEWLKGNPNIEQKPADADYTDIFNRGIEYAILRMEDFLYLNFSQVKDSRYRVEYTSTRPIEDLSDFVETFKSYIKK